LIAQWRECCAIAGSIAKKGTPNHLLVNKIMKYSIDYFHFYTSYVIDEMKKRNYNVNDKSIINFTKNQPTFNLYYCTRCRTGINVYSDWHNERYLLQCLANLSEKYDCGGIPEEEWQKIKSAFPEQIKLIYNGGL